MTKNTGKTSIRNYYRRKASLKMNIAVFSAVFLGLLLIVAGYYISTSRSQLFFFIFLGLILSFSLFFSITRSARKWRKVLRIPFPDTSRKILEKHVAFYNKLPHDEKIYFEQRVAYFLHTKMITPISCTIDEKLKLFIASSAIMPVFSFPDFFYRNINEILVYPDTFDQDYSITSEHDRKNISGMVGSGEMSRMMILSKKHLLKAFDDRIDADNVAVHEFVHLIDMADGSVDGIPALLLNEPATIPWIKLMQSEMEKIKRRNSDIDRYALSNQGEFLAVVSEYFFDSPDKFKERHPQLFMAMQKIFKSNK